YLPIIPFILHPPTRSTPFPYTTLFRSLVKHRQEIGSPHQDEGCDGVDFIQKRDRNGDQNQRQHGQRVSPVDPLEQLVQSQGYKRSEEHTSELQSRENLVCRLLLEKKKK